jgi:hypothetical protein
LGWGIVATWWVGLPFGGLLAVCARAGSHPRLPARELFRPVLRLLGAMAVLALVAGVAGYVAARAGLLVLVEPLASEIAPGRHALFLADGAAHTTAYAAGFFGGCVICSRTARRRRITRQ